MLYSDLHTGSGPGVSSREEREMARIAITFGVDLGIIWHYDGRIQTKKRLQDLNFFKDNSFNTSSPMVRHSHIKPQSKGGF